MNTIDTYYPRSRATDVASLKGDVHNQQGGIHLLPPQNNLRESAGLLSPDDRGTLPSRQLVAV